MCLAEFRLTKGFELDSGSGRHTVGGERCITEGSVGSCYTEGRATSR